MSFENVKINVTWSRLISYKYINGTDELEYKIGIWESLFTWTYWRQIQTDWPHQLGGIADKPNKNERKLN